MSYTAPAKRIRKPIVIAGIAILGPPLVLVILGPAALLRAAVLQALWYLYAVPLTHLPPIPYAAALAIVLAVLALRAHKTPRYDDPKPPSFWKTCGYELAHAAIILILALAGTLFL